MLKSIIIITIYTIFIILIGYLQEYDYERQVLLKFEQNEVLECKNYKIDKLNYFYDRKNNSFVNKADYSIKTDINDCR